MSFTQASRATELPALYCASHTITGVLPGQPARHGFFERVDAVAQAGFDGLVIHFRDHFAQVAGGRDPVAMRDHVAAAGLVVPSIDFLADWHDGATLGSLDRAIETAHLFGATHLNVGADLAGRNVALEDLMPPFDRLCRRAAAAGLKVALEVIAWGRVASLDNALDLARAGGGTAGLLLDAWHLSVEGPMPLDQLTAIHPSLVAGLQISDALPMSSMDVEARMRTTQNRQFPGEGGGVDLTSFLAALWAAACARGVTVEVISPVAAEMSVGQCATRAAETGLRVLTRVAEARSQGGRDV